MRTLIFGSGTLARNLVAEITTSHARHYRLAGIVSESGSQNGEFAGYPVTGSIEDLQTVIAATVPDMIIVALENQRGFMPVNQLLEARIHNGIVVEDGRELYEKFTGKVAIESVTPGSVIFSRDYRPSVAARLMARTTSLVLVALGIVLLLPLMMAVAAAIKLDSRGPVFFTQDRLGRGGRHFKLWKFRTMFPENRKLSEWARDNNHRITRTGKWLRKFRIDELPQFFNVLAGDMNLVGPRPHPVSNFELMVLVSRNTPESGRPIPFYALRSIVPPGITGWAQVRYKYANDINEEMEKLRFDLYYIKHYSVWLDLRILFETVKVVVLGRESAGTEVSAADKMEVVR